VVVLGSATIDGTVQGDVAVLFGHLRLGPTAVVDGSTVVVAGNMTVASGATVWRDLVAIGGIVTAPPDFTPGGEHFVIGTPALGYRLRAVATWITRGPLWGRIIVPSLPWIWAVLGIVFLLSLLLNHIFAPAVRGAADAVLTRPIRTLLMGLLLVVVIGPILAILAASIVGLIVVPFALAGLFIGWSIGKVGVTRGLGMSVVAQDDPESRAQSLRSFLIGFVILTIAYTVPVLGLTAWALVAILGLGAAGLAFVERRRRDRPVGIDPEVPVSTPVSSLAPEGAPVPVARPSAAAPAPEPLIHVTVPSPPPPPEPPAPGSVALLPHAAFFDRAAAFAIDCLLVAVAIHLLERNDDMYPLWLLVYHVGFWIWKGTTLGGIICNLRVVKTTGEPLQAVDAVVRGLASLLSIAALGIGCLWMLRDPDRQTWHDKIAGTYVVKVPKNWPL
jgi:uncharacterized RDD family membrane protein YckC